MTARSRWTSEKSFVRLGLELLVVILGILIAFQVERWAEDRRERKQEYEYLLRLKDDLQFEIARLESGYRSAQSRINTALLLEGAIANPIIASDQADAVSLAVEKTGWNSFPQIDGYVYNELQSSGNLALMRSVALRRSLANYYTAIHHYSRVGLDLDIQRQFIRLTTGILTSTELRAIEDESWHDQPNNVSADRATEIVQELASRQGAVDLIPNIVQHHVFNQKVIDLTRDQASAIVFQIDSLIEDYEK